MKNLIEFIKEYINTKYSLNNCDRRTLNRILNKLDHKELTNISLDILNSESIKLTK